MLYCSGLSIAIISCETCKTNAEKPHNLFDSYEQRRVRPKNLQRVSSESPANLLGEFSEVNQIHTESSQDSLKIFMGTHWRIFIGDACWRSVIWSILRTFEGSPENQEKLQRVRFFRRNIPVVHSKSLSAILSAWCLNLNKFEFYLLRTVAFEQLRRRALNSIQWKALKRDPNSKIKIREIQMLR